ncbi:MAG: TIGR03086 family protein [Bifidobacteriaceae bacterium]|nr:TIGR03086 family protein [Bifidobacteriaceae bacterium]
MTATPAYGDTRPVFFATLEWVNHLIEQVTEAQLAWPTPDEGWTVADLLKHVVRVTGMITLPGDAKMPAVPDGATPAQQFAAAAAAARVAWDGPAGTAGLTEPTRVPPDRTVPKAEALLFFSQEFMVHGWDLATALNLPAEAPAPAAQAVLAYAKATTATTRPAGGPFGPVVEVASDAGTTRQLAAYLGR